MNLTFSSESPAVEHPVSLQGQFSVSPPRLHPGAYRVECVTHAAFSSELLGFWESLLEKSHSEEKIFQSPAFFRFLRQESGNAELFAIRRSADDELIGLAPVRRLTHEVELRVGRHRLGRTVPVVQVLGSTLLLPSEPGALEALSKQLLAHFDGVQAMLMQALPQALYADYRNMASLRASLVDGWRACHTMPLPETFEAYLQKFSAKKRYNLSRQVRLLAKEAGEIELVRVEHEAQVPEMMNALAALAPSFLCDAGATPARYTGLAAQGLLLAYRLRCGGRDVALIMGIRSPKIWHVHNIFCLEQYAHLSLGTSVVHLSLQDIITALTLEAVDFGYGTPGHDFRSSHVLKPRGRVVVYRRGSGVGLLIGLQQLYDQLYGRLVQHAKRLRKRQDKRHRQGRTDVSSTEGAA